MRKSTSAILIAAICLTLSGRSFGWAYQGHMLLTRLAVLRIINDPTAPQGLRDFLQHNMKSSKDDCEKLATTLTVGSNIEGTIYDQGLDKWCTMPDRIQNTPEGKLPIAPYGAPEAQMHFLDMEVFGKAMVYKEDMSDKPDVDKIPHDVTDPRWKLGGFVPFRVEEMFNKLAVAMGRGDTVGDPEAALQAAGYLAHYCEDSTQPHHSTVDYKSVSYLAGHLKSLPAADSGTPAALMQMRLPQGVNPHGDIEYEIYADDLPPRDQFRKDFWTDLNSYIDQLAANHAGPPPLAQFDPFRWDLHVLSDSYDYLPFVGHAAIAAYATGVFDPKAFFGFSGPTHGHTINMVQLIALQNAKAVLNVEAVYRMAWQKAHQ